MSAWRFCKQAPIQASGAEAKPKRSRSEAEASECAFNWIAKVSIK